MKNSHNPSAQRIAKKTRFLALLSASRFAISRSNGAGTGSWEMGEGPFDREGPADDFPVVVGYWGAVMTFACDFDRNYGEMTHDSADAAPRSSMIPEQPNLAFHSF